MRQFLGLLNEDLFMQVGIIWGSRILKVIIILILARLALRFGFKLFEKLFTPTSEKAVFFPEKKAKTLSGLLTSVWRYFIYAFTAVLVLTELNIVEIGPILAGAGVIGLAVGFGAQSLVRDVISGFFIILEDQFSIGDYITVGSYSGIVEELGLRITKIRDFNGELHILPNGQIEAVTNHARGNMRALVEVGVAYEEDIDHVLSVLEELSRRFATDNADVVEGPTVLGVVALDDSAVVIRLIARTVSMAQWKVERDLRRAIKNEFDGRGIEIPYPRRVVYRRAENEEAGDNG
jgi:moderate conductance mechanosensitive channel